MASKNKRHVHKYHKVSLGYTDVWACALPDCTHYIPQYSEPLVNGKRSLCWECGDEFILHPIAMKDRAPNCDNCRLGVKPAEVEMSEELRKKLEALGISPTKIA